MPFNPYGPITKEVVAELVATKRPEDRNLDYKRDLPASPDELRKKLVVPASAFANASGGVLFYGISEEQDESGVPDQVVGVAGANADDVKRQFEEVLARSVKPRIPGVSIEDIVLDDGKRVVAVRVPRSWSAPHLIQKVGDDTWVSFYMRRNASNLAMDWQEIRGSVAAGEGQRERIERFRNDRIGKIVSDAVGWPLKDTAKLILHVVPLGAVGGEALIPMSNVRDRAIHLQPMGPTGPINFVLEGAVNNAVDPDSGASESYALLFREGMIEAVDADLVRPDDQGNRWIASVAFERDARARVPGYLEMLRSYGVAPPIVLMLSATGVLGARMTLGPGGTQRNQQVIGHDTIVFAPSVLNDYSEDLDRLLKPMFDAFWNAAGWPRSLNWSDEGKWIGDRR